MNKHNWTIPITVVLLFVGIFLSVQFQNQTRLYSDLSSLRTENLIAMIRDLTDKRQKLNAEILDLSSKLETQSDTFTDERNRVENLKSELEKLHIITGATPLKGTGLTVTITQNMPVLYIDIINIVNELWAAGAEAIAINNHRVTSQTTIFYNQDDNSMSITVNSIKLPFPIIIKALGDPNSLEKGLTLPGGIMDNLALFKAYPILVKEKSLSVPAATPVRRYFLTEYQPPQDGTAQTAAPKAFLPNKQQTAPTAN